MKWTPLACLAIVMMLAGAVPASAQSLESAPASSAVGTPLVDVLAAISKKTKKNFVVDPRAPARLSLSDPARLSYDQFLDVLQIHGLVAVERGDVIIVTVDANARTLPVPLIGANEKLPDAEIVTRIIHVRNLPAAQLVPILRPLVPQYGHLAASRCTNDLILVDRYANAKRLESIIQALDTGEPYKPEKCGEPASRD
jgi:general secretion pathway protein D